ncbi:ATP-binding protein [Anaerolineales bacterium HSG25]|nr:ATP-binding protein [Anaerolineales bacterium HSG25]
MYNFLRNVSLFSELPDDNLQQLLQITTEIHLLKNANLFEQGNFGNYAYIIIEGKIEICINSGRHELSLAIRKKGEVIGEMSLLDKAPRMASARALSDCILLSIHREQFNNLLNNNPSVARGILYNITARWRDTEIILKDREKTLLEQSTQLTDTYKALKKAHGSLEQRVQERTAELAMANASLTKQIEVRKQAEKELQRYRDHLEELVSHRTDELSQANIKLQSLNQHLHQEVIQRTQAEAELQKKNEELSKTLRDLKSTQDELIQSEKMAVLGQLVAGVAHEVNSPLGAIRASISNITNALDHSLQQLPALLMVLSPEEQANFMSLVEIIAGNKERLSSRETRKLRRGLKKTLKEYNINETDRLAERLVEMGIYKDITPYLSLLEHPDNMFIIQVAYNLFIQKNNSRNIMIAVEKASKVVFALKSYARYDVSAQKSEANIIEGIDIVLVIYHNQIKRGIEVITNYDDISSILCYPDELNQVWTNIIHNAIQAMQGKGLLEISVCQLETMPTDLASTETDLSTATTPCVMVTIADNGPGISPEIQSRIFKPFFTTKPVGVGSGLGLDIVQKIVDKHHGKIEVESEPGRTVFDIYLPIL